MYIGKNRVEVWRTGSVNPQNRLSARFLSLWITHDGSKVLEKLLEVYGYTLEKRYKDEKLTRSIPIFVEQIWLNVAHWGMVREQSVRFELLRGFRKKLVSLPDIDMIANFWTEHYFLLSLIIESVRGNLAARTSVLRDSRVGDDLYLWEKLRSWRIAGSIGSGTTKDIEKRAC